MSRWFWLAIFCSLICIACCNPSIAEVRNAGDRTPASSAEDRFKLVAAQVSRLIKEYFPRARIELGSRSLKVEFKTKRAISVYSKRAELMPKIGGVICYLDIKDGKYRGRDILNAEINQYYYAKVTAAPYSKADDCHLLARISYATETPKDFVHNFKRIVAQFVPAAVATRRTDSKGDRDGPGEPEASKKKNRERKVERQPVLEARTTANDQLFTRPVGRRKLFLWKAARGDDTVYLLGTIHAAKKNFYPLPAGIMDAFNESNHLCLEIDVTDDSLLKELSTAKSRSKAKGVYQSPDRLEDKLSARTKKVFEEYLEWSGETWEMYNKYRPWLAMSIIEGSVPRRGELAKISGRYGIDFFLVRQALKRDMPISGLEGKEREFFSKVPEFVQDTQLLVLLTELKNTNNYLRNLFEIWKAGDVEAMLSNYKRREEKYPELRQYHKMLLDDRNERMVSRLLELMPKRDGPHFVAVGSAHLVGKKSIVDLLREKGFTVKQLDESSKLKRQLSQLIKQSAGGAKAGADASVEATVDNKGESEESVIEFAPGPFLQDRKDLYTMIRDCEKIGIGTEGYMVSFNDLEKYVRQGASKRTVGQLIQRIEDGMGEQIEEKLKNVGGVSGGMTSYCIKLEKLLAGKFANLSALKDGCTVMCTIYGDGTAKRLRISKKSDCKGAGAQQVLSAIKSVGKFPPPPRNPMPVKIFAHRDAGKMEVSYAGFIDYAPYMKLMQRRIKASWRPPRGESNHAVVVVYKIHRNGLIDDVKVLKSSGDKKYDAVAVRTMRQLSIIDPLPDGSGKSVRVKFTFAYNVIRHRSRAIRHY